MILKGTQTWIRNPSRPAPPSVFCPSKRLIPHCMPVLNSLHWPSTAASLFLPAFFLSSFSPHQVQADHAIYLDADTLILHPVDHIWELFRKFGHFTVFGATMETEGEESWYTAYHSTLHPFFSPTGINAGKFNQHTRNRQLDLRLLDIISSSHGSASQHLL